MGFYSINDIKNIFKPSGSQPINGFKDEVIDLVEAGYKIKPENWFTAQPYGFKFTPKDGNTITMYLPISPSNLTINTNFATNVISTLYGTVEEHSSVRYYDILIEGNTGITPNYVEPSTDKPKKETGRSSFPVQTGIPSLGGFFSKTINTINRIYNQANDLINGDQETETGVYTNKTGYVAFHNLYRFLLKYKQDVSGDINSTQGRDVHPLIFFNYKDNNQYNVVVRSFSLRRSAENPMLYYYSISLRGYNLASAGDEYGTEDLNKRLSDLGLNSVDSSSILGKIKGTANRVKGIVGSIAGGINILGR
jgi:hypothetical protein